MRYWIALHVLVTGVKEGMLLWKMKALYPCFIYICSCLRSGKQLAYQDYIVTKVLYMYSQFGLYITLNKSHMNFSMPLFVLMYGQIGIYCIL